MHMLNSISRACIGHAVPGCPLNVRLGQPTWILLSAPESRVDVFQQYDGVLGRVRQPVLQPVIRHAAVREVEDADRVLLPFKKCIRLHQIQTYRYRTVPIPDEKCPICIDYFFSGEKRSRL